MTATERALRRRAILAAAGAVALIAAGIVTVLRAPSEIRPLDFSETADPAWPQETLRDAVTYADQVSVVVVRSERALETDPERIDRDGGLVGREVVVEVEETIWRRPGAPELRGSEPMFVWGWMVQGELWRPIVAGGPRLEVGGRYLVGLAEAEPGTWGQFADGFTLPLDGDRVAAPEGIEPTSRYAKAFAGLALAEVAARLEETPPDPRAAPFAHLPPERRWNAASRNR